jgi:hypothetical protein
MPPISWLLLTSISSFTTFHKYILLVVEPKNVPPDKLFVMTAVARGAGLLVPIAIPFIDIRLLERATPLIVMLDDTLTLERNKQSPLTSRVCVGLTLFMPTRKSFRQVNTFVPPQKAKVKAFEGEFAPT